MSNCTLPSTTVSMFRERREIDGLRGDKGEAVLVEGGGLATADGILIAMHHDNGRQYRSLSWCHCGNIAMVDAELFDVGSWQ